MQESIKFGRQNIAFIGVCLMVKHFSVFHLTNLFYSTNLPLFWISKGLKSRIWLHLL